MFCEHFFNFYNVYIQIFVFSVAVREHENEIDIQKISALRHALNPLTSIDDQLVDEQVAKFVNGTREWAFNDFDQWCQADLKHRVHVLVANAGVGKTGILCKLVRERSDVVVAYHFCRHDDTSRSNPRRMLCSIAFQLAESFSTYREALYSLNLTRENLEEGNINGLFSKLFVGPLHALENPSNGKRVILIDALDECDHDGGKNDILQCIARNFDKLPKWLGVYVTTRPKTSITNKLKKFYPDLQQNFTSQRAA